MCKQCEKNPLYEFTNKRKLCKNCFVNYFNKKFLFTIRKFGMINHEDIIGYSKNNSFKEVVLEDMLNFFSKKSGISVVKLPNKRANKIASDSSIDSEANEIVKKIIEGNAINLKKDLPVEKNLIKPLYLFSDEEILLYAKIKNLKFKEEKNKKNKIESFLDKFEKKHPEVKRAVVNSLLELYK
jgi:tRNA(Ile)-lysidine synthase TilS/MesJ